MQNGSIGYGVFSTIQNKVDFCLKVNRKRFWYFLKWNNAEPTKIGLIKNPYLQEMFVFVLKYSYGSKTAKFAVESLNFVNFQVLP